MPTNQPAGRPNDNENEENPRENLPPQENDLDAPENDLDALGNDLDAPGPANAVRVDIAIQVPELGFENIEVANVAEVQNNVGNAERPRRRLRRGPAATALPIGRIQLPEDDPPPPAEPAPSTPRAQLVAAILEVRAEQLQQQEAPVRRRRGPAALGLPVGPGNEDQGNPGPAEPREQPEGGPPADGEELPPRREENRNAAREVRDPGEMDDLD